MLLPVVIVSNHRNWLVADPCFPCQDTFRYRRHVDDVAAPAPEEVAFSSAGKPWSFDSKDSAFFMVAVTKSFSSLVEEFAEVNTERVRRAYVADLFAFVKRLLAV